MRKILVIAYYTLKENVRNKVFYGLVFFASLLFFATILFSVLGGEQNRRLLFDFGVGAVELFAFLSAVFASVTLILEEIENKTIYLILVRPLRRTEYLFGRYLGVLFSVYLSIILMSVIHLILLFLQKVPLGINYFLVLFGLCFKIALITALGLFFSLFSTSAVLSISLTFFFWLLGHFTGELKFLAEKLPNFLLKSGIKLFYCLLPNFQYFNFRDRLEIAEGLDINFFFLATLYGLVYTGSCFVLSGLIFARKEF